MRQYDSLLHAPPALAAAPNMNALWARLTVEELCRSGITTFAIAPGATPGACELTCIGQAVPSMDLVWVLALTLTLTLNIDVHDRTMCRKSGVQITSLDVHRPKPMPFGSMFTSHDHTSLTIPSCAGSRSSPLTLAAAMHPRAHVVSCIDERSLAFWALGYGKATGCAALSLCARLTSERAYVQTHTKWSNFWNTHMMSNLDRGHGWVKRKSSIAYLLPRPRLPPIPALCAVNAECRQL